ncbi:MAG: magnesium transporter MgtE N-terminal domain-containing protein [Parabacteroides merdae]
MIELTKEYIDHLKDIITEKDDAKIKEILDELYPADIAELYQELDLQEAIYLYLLMDGEKAADVLMELDEDRHKLLKRLPNELIADASYGQYGNRRRCRPDAWWTKIPRKRFFRTSKT